MLSNYIHIYIIDFFTNFKSVLPATFVMNARNNSHNVPSSSCIAIRCIYSFCRKKNLEYIHSPHNEHRSSDPRPVQLCSDQ